MDVPAPGTANSGPVISHDEIGDLLHIAAQIERHYGCALELRREHLAGLDEAGRYDCVLARMAERQLLPPNAGSDQLRGLLKVYQANLRAVQAYRPVGPCAADITLLVGDDLRPACAADPTLGWAALTRGKLRTVQLAGDHLAMLLDPYAQTVAAQLAALLNEAG
jgi:thioesterase domain-containing protein